MSKIGDNRAVGSAVSEAGRYGHSACSKSGTGHARGADGQPAVALGEVALGAAGET